MRMTTRWTMAISSIPPIQQLQQLAQYSRLAASARHRPHLRRPHSEYWKWKSAEPTSTYFDGGGGLTDPSAIEDLKHLAQTAPGSN